MILQGTLILTEQQLLAPERAEQQLFRMTRKRYLLGGAAKCSLHTRIKNRKLSALKAMQFAVKEADAARTH
ncbi:hypothetical protein [Bradyrhizobium betae]|uniref:hypothetical protein n=1 Tax=Bradyrhizobium betae TaxID=244734 RepID=UPI001FDEF8BE|nr:hypothetical protein [Bradyrhizobium betae]